MNQTTITTTDIDELLAFLPIFEDHYFEPVQNWNPWPVYSSQGKAFNQQVSKPCWQDFNYLASEAAHKMDDLANIASSSLDEIKSMLTLYMRSERFGDGSWAHHFETGHITAILRRLQVIRGNLPA